MNDNNSLKKLKSVNRYINAYYNSNEELGVEYEINLSIDQIKLIIEPREDDYRLYLPYALNEYQLKQFNSLFNLQVEYDLGKFFYVLECFGNYD